MRTLQHPASAGSTWSQRLGVGAILFFTLKGLAWLVVPVVLAWWAR